MEPTKAPEKPGNPIEATPATKKPGEKKSGSGSEVDTAPKTSGTSAETTPTAPNPAEPTTPLMEPTEYDKIIDTKYSLFPHKGTFVLPFVYNWNPHEELYDLYTQQPNASGEPFYDKTEMEFQISFMIPVARKLWDTPWDILFAYTHHSWWQLYNSDWSKPFRETNYNPEVFGRYIFQKQRRFARFRVFASDIGIMHQSNGQIQALSRSWDRIFARIYAKSPYVFMVLTGWYRLPEGENDDNRNILRYMGYGDLEVYKLWGNNSWSVKVPLSERPGVELRYSYPWRNSLRWFVNYRTGYGHSLIEYNRYTDRIGVGLILESFLDSPAIDTPEED